MNAGKLWLLREFIGTNKVLFKIPVYQRNYDWSEKNCNRLLDDTKRILETGKKHFLGTIVFMASKEHGFSLQEYTIIDGQQRLTTMMILLKALADAAEGVDNICKSEINDSYIHNKYCEIEEFKVKLKPIKSDNDQFVALLKNKYDDIDPNSRIWANYQTCKNKIEKWMKNGISPGDILAALEKLEIVNIVLIEGEDDPQVIFESINSTGLELTHADLIRNYLLMNAKNQDFLYEDYWTCIEKMLKRGNDYSNLNLFFTQYLIYKTNTNVNLKYLYDEFLKMYKNEHFTQESILKELKYYADIFQAFVYDTPKYPEEINQILKKIRQLNQSTCYPFLLHVFNDYEQKVITIDTLQRTLNLILSYILRRVTCGVPSNSLRGFFITLYGRIFKVTSNKSRYYESINKFLWSISSHDVIPSDSEFKRVLETSQIYPSKTLCKYLLMDIENGGSKEILNTDSLTIEHIMPQTLSSEWRYIKAEDHEKYLHVLGNLSVTGYNSELSNKSFSEKVELIQENSKAVILNKDIVDKTKWDIPEIKNRSKRLAGIIMKRYHIDKIDDPSIEFEYIKKITMEDDYNEVTGKKLLSFSFNGELYRQNKFTLMLLDMVKILDKQNPGILDTLADRDYSYTPKFKRPYISRSTDNIIKPETLKDNIYIETRINPSGIMKFIESLIEEFKADKSTFSISVIADDYIEDEEE
ncbi:DUF262 domain-containing protein [Enterocloster aldenensis]|uniref:DUF262 domain-containing protein n=1 Tax=Enterocloster aldenensis TaxID=358742 RepID=UPI000E4A868C|nr:DUF262 domain-containing protein [Enterocloster aldenensis]